MDFSHVDASQWPRVVARDAHGNERIATFEKGVDYIELSDGTHLTTQGVGKLALLTEDEELKATYERRLRIRKRVFGPTAEDALLNDLLHPERVALIVKMKWMHERGEA